MKLRDRILSLALAVSLLPLVLGTGALALTDTGAEIAAQASAGVSYYSYLAQNAQVPAAKEALDAALTEVLGIDAEAAVDGRTGMLFTADSAAVYTVNVPETAWYHLAIDYSYTLDNPYDLPYSILVDGEAPFMQTENLTLKRLWRDAGPMQQDQRGNDLIPEQECVQQWQTVLATDHSGYTGKPLRIVLPAGEHTITICASGGLVLGGLGLQGEKQIKSYDELQSEYAQLGYEKAEGRDTFITVQGEDTLTKSDRTLYPVYDRSNAATYPNSPTELRRNIIGGSVWSEAGMRITYRVRAEKAGLYCLSVKYRQNEKLGMAVGRTVYINEEIPCAEFQNVMFPYTSRWQQYTLGSGGEPYYVYLHEGENTVAFEATLAALSDILLEVSDVNIEMNALYRRIIMVTSSNPDSYQDYFLDREIPDISLRFEALSERLTRLSHEFETVNGLNSDKSAVLLRVAERMQDFADDVDEIPNGLGAFRDDISVVSNWLMECREQPLEIDSFTLHAPEYRLPRANGTFWERLVFAVQRFFASFSDDYQTLEDYDSGSAGTITVWVNSGRDQAQIIKDMSLQFTARTGINVNVNIVQGGLIEATLAGIGPDIAIDCPRGQPVNLASRNALADLTQFSDFDEVASRFSDDAVLPYSYDGGVYALPLTQTFLVMFYRTDILAEMGIPLPQTWDELLAASAKLQRNNMTVGLPYTAISAAGAVDIGVGAKDLYPTLLMQYGGDYYNDSLTATELGSPAALDAFKTWTSFYTQYSFPLSYDFNSRFRTGEMPIAIAPFTMYGVLSAAAPEIRGQWEMGLMPGTVDDSGALDRSGGMSGTSIVMMRGAEDKNACWEYMRWFTDTATQIDYGMRLENLLGASARLASANLEAFRAMNWSSTELAVLDSQRGCVREIPELPGGYYTSRCIDNAFRAVVYQHENERIALEEADDTINRELERKREELS